MGLAESKHQKHLERPVKFIYVENLTDEEKVLTESKDTIVEKENNNVKSTTDKDTSQQVDRPTLNLIYKAVKDNSDENGWANLSEVGQYINNVRPDFDSRNYGRAKLSGLIKMLNLFETRIEGSQMFLKKLKNNKVSNPDNKST